MSEAARQRNLVRRRERYWRYIRAGSCTDCGAESTHGKTRCTPCGQRNSRGGCARYWKRHVPRTGAASPEKDVGL